MTAICRRFLVRKTIATLVTVFTIGTVTAADVPVAQKTKLTAKAYIASCADKDIPVVIAETKKLLKKTAAGTEKQTITCFLAECQERISLFADASKTWYDAAFSGSNGAREDVYLVRAAICALNSGEYKTAAAYLNPVLLTATNSDVLARARLTSAWITAADGKTEEAISLLNTYATSSDKQMTEQRPAILFSLWYITDENKYRDTLKKDYPTTPETAVATGQAQLVPGTFWYFLPRTVVSAMKVPEDAPTPSSTVTTQKDTTVKNDIPVRTASSSDLTENTTASTNTFWQTGFYKNQEYADAMVKKLKDLGFTPVVRKQKRSSGTEYYAVGVMENNAGTIAPDLRNAGIECAPVFEK